MESSFWCDALEKLFFLNSRAKRRFTLLHFIQDWCNTLDDSTESFCLLLKTLLLLHELCTSHGNELITQSLQLHVRAATQLQILLHILCIIYVSFSIQCLSSWFPLFLIWHSLLHMFKNPEWTDSEIRSNPTWNVGGYVPRFIFYFSPCWIVVDKNLFFSASPADTLCSFNSSCWWQPRLSEVLV